MQSNYYIKPPPNFGWLWKTKTHHTLWSVDPVTTDPLHNTAVECQLTKTANLSVPCCSCCYTALIIIFTIVLHKFVPKKGVLQCCVRFTALHLLLKHELPEPWVAWKQCLPGITHYTHDATLNAHSSVLLAGHPRERTPARCHSSCRTACPPWATACSSSRTPTLSPSPCPT